MTRRNRGLLADFQDFIMRGNVIDLALAVIIGGAFGKIINSLVEDIITPVILNPAMKASGVEKLSELSIAGIQYGLFLAAILNFLVIAFCLFLIIRSFEMAKKRLIRQEEAIAEEQVSQIITDQERLITAMERLADTIERQNQSS
ncbi:large conductance mechanosensitive channel protein MscL [Crocosphaera sp. UHCC 0190]|uniref:large conductance mechanosensitive channel protein MscL n=1 Tax=Crocosphaera sp. UHCC 0190 TaxID=3110246 RepID=UPI002B204375|nr:large conductance mechanosensitive channel protein MscL [Crocosphaera sp. UHCC 0190]MEA5509358.1 large conductance mechanosensitive channel protein MscL [Crocosphaera sp. UHCC 0190]